MVCQAASQTRFRALKHENGIAGRTTIIVRVIACFQPLQNCQAEYFRQLLKPVTIPESNRLCWTEYDCYTLVCSFVLIVTAKESSQMSQQFLKSPDLDQMARAQLDQNYNLPYFNSSTLTTDVAFQGQINSDLRVGEFLKLPRPYGNIPYPAENPYLKNPQIALPHSGLRVSGNKPIGASCALQEKKFLIFDRSDDHGSSYDIDPSKRDKKVKIRETLKILESIIPGSKSDKDPISVIEKAIFYLESMRIEAEALGLTGPQSKSAD
ncbi:hypothetical protein PHJA_003015000 [Phtheirospermum japonicum]|uniref:BHLH domain-containing protein n=1 Tax=Phtheirospermum japonicum TaxID=374723 RepID=A0A830DC51_9LAMI|nr:hypothetical protein PHJA_003015000 [Phtheirospermum japonicum]